MATTTFLFTDIEGSTRLWETHPEAMRAALAAHDETTTKHVDAHGGRVVKHMGDGAIAAFAAAGEAIDAAIALQVALAGQVHPDVGALRVRMGIHSGEVEERDGDYFGPTLNRAARLMAAGHGGQVLVSLVSQRLAGPRDDLVDLGEFRLRDLGQPERIFQVATEVEFPPLRTLDVAPNNLPVFPTSFVGRQREVEEVTDLVRGSRLVTVTGVGGAGKTRLALQVAADLASGYPDGVWLVELGAVTATDLVDGAVAEALGVVQDGTATLRESIVAYLSDRDALLVVDNCEHLVEAAADLVGDAMGASAGLDVVATSRELLGIAGEVAFGLRSLRLPPEGDLPAPQELAGYDAVQLFTERATAAKPDFHLDAAAAPHVVEICRRLDGMPLALELAASRVRSFSVAKIAELLDQRFRLLTGGSRTALPRQQTLAATIEWSYRLLDEREQALLRRLSAFQGGFTYESVAEVAAGEPIDEFDLMELLPALVDKSLVVADEVEGQVRYRLLETIRQFARDLFEDTDEADAVRLRHAEHFTTLAEEAGHHIRGPDEAEWWARIDRELDNLRLAATWAVEHDHATLALRLVSGFWRYWWFKGRWIEGAFWIEGVLEAAEAEADDLLLARGLLAHGSLVEFTNPETRARLGVRRDPTESLERSRDLYARLHEAGIDPTLLHQGYCAAIINLGVLAELDRDFARVQALMREALDVAREIGDTAGITVALGNLAQGAIEAGDFDEARRLHDEAIVVAEQLGSNARLADSWSQRSQIELEAGDVAAAGNALATARQYAVAADLPHLVAFLEVCLAINAVFAGTGDAANLRTALAAMAAHDTVLRAPGFAIDLLAGQLVVDALGGLDEHAAVAWGALGNLEVEARYLDGHLEPIVAELRDRLGDEAFEAATARGAALDPDEVVALLVG